MGTKIAAWAATPEWRARVTVSAFIDQRVYGALWCERPPVRPPVRVQGSEPPFLDTSLSEESRNEKSLVGVRVKSLLKKTSNS